MTDDLKEQLGVYGKLGTRGSDHPHSVVCREALARITDLEARLAAAEAGEDALAEALRSYRADLCEGFCLEAEWSDEAHNHPAMQRDCGGCLAAAALAAYEARRKG